MSIGKITSLPELNFNIVWNMVDFDSRKAFIGTPQKVKLPAGFELYKLTEFYLANRSGKITEWWSPVNSFGIDPRLQEKIKLARHLGVPLSELVRVMSAVKENWNALSYLLRAKLLLSVYGFWGQCSMMNRLDHNQHSRPGITPSTRTINLPGYAWQLYIPNLTTMHIVQVCREQL